ncbi:MAG: NAD(P)-dependent oxidoreductase [Polyangiaceae bacterium]
MRIALYLPSSVPEFCANEAQLRRLALLLAPHELAVANSEAELIALLPRVSAAVVWAFRAEWYALAPSLEHVLTPSAGRESIALDPNGRARAHFGTFHGQIMAESLLAMIAFTNRRLGAALADQARAHWDRSPYSGSRRLHGQTALLVGYGSIGKHCAALLRAVGMHVHGVRRQGSTEGLDRAFSLDELGDALTLADHVVSLLPGGASGFFGEAEFARMKPSACFYNLGRGGTVDEAALLSALATQRIAGAFLDVVATEPLPPESPLWRTPNLFLTPHASAICVEYLDLYFEELAPLLHSLLG